MSTKFEDVKEAIVKAQLASTPRDKVINDVIKGSAELLSASDIISRLSITVNEFRELVGLPNHYIKIKPGASIPSVIGESSYYSKELYSSDIELINKELEKNISFPKPDLYILGKARWKKETFKKWLEEQCG
ncbi:hypothetical protein CDE51_09940 [Pasteurella multocida]|uniref:hypothetical protein n=1 Tax=Pasteurella multocida TaxID=747 RepID=UPI000B6A06EF|nr:hypothetical protein [Pasteurella multocida]MDX3898665.1 hypothetical protein [Pasteurella multocida]MDX3956625.1 hypothetical protein [Pasteurella multocida]OWZ81621.1 hypothetical protein CDE51_09940 [Pasteurella multocida]HDR1420435.1 hypothetical protein [Pasteurella multocida]